MNQRALIAAAAASVLMSTAAFAASHAAAPAAPAAAKEKCFGIAKAGQNDCANLSGSHSCAGQSKLSDDKGEWKYVVKGTCASMKGISLEDAKKMGMKS